jgi:hypothetical protein
MAEGWSREEVEATVASYFAMLERELRGEPYNKSEHRRALKPLLAGRSDPAIELKHYKLSRSSRQTVLQMPRQRADDHLADLGVPEEVDGEAVAWLTGYAFAEVHVEEAAG